MRTTQQQPGRAPCGRGNSAEGSRMRPHALSWDVGEYPPYCHADAWSAVRLIYISPLFWGGMPVTDGYAICGFFFC